MEKNFETDLTSTSNSDVSNNTSTEVSFEISPTPEIADENRSRTSSGVHKHMPHELVILTSDGTWEYRPFVQLPDGKIIEDVFEYNPNYSVFALKKISPLKLKEHGPTAKPESEKLIHSIGGDVWVDGGIAENVKCP